MFMGPAYPELPEALVKDSEPFFVPSYLSGSSYLRKLEAAYRSRHQARTEALREHCREMATGIPRGDTGVKIHPTAGGTTAGLTPTNMKRISWSQWEDELTPLPSRWNSSDSWGTLEFLDNARSLKFVGPRGHQDRDHEAAAARADYHMPAECGIYYYEVHIIYGKRDE
jgi:hypothetical protein